MKKIILTIPIVMILSACSSLENNYLIQAEALYEKGRYNDASALYKKILMKDPYNLDAVRLETKISKGMLENAKKKYPPYEGCHVWKKIEETKKKTHNK